MTNDLGVLKDHVSCWFELRCKCTLGRCVQVPVKLLCQELDPDRSVELAAGLFRCRHCDNRPEVLLIDDITLGNPVSIANSREPKVIKVR